MIISFTSVNAINSLFVFCLSLSVELKMAIVSGDSVCSRRSKFDEVTALKIKFELEIDHFYLLDAIAEELVSLEVFQSIEDIPIARCSVACDGSGVMTKTQSCLDECEMTVKYFYPKPDGYGASLLDFLGNFVCLVHGFTLICALVFLCNVHDPVR